MNFRRAVMILSQESLLLLTFLSSVWIEVGIMGGQSFLTGPLMSLYAYLPNQIFFWILPFFLLFSCILGSYFIGGWVGLLSLILVFLGGTILNDIYGLILLIFGMIVGIFAPLRE